ncbi:MAG: ribonuclease P protein component [Clostridium sp.]
MVYKLKKNIEFRIVYRRGKSFANDILVLYVLKNNKNKDKDKDNSLYNKVGISVSKKVGNSVVRSRSKRLILENYRIKQNNINKKGYDFVFVARTKIKDKSYHDVEKAMDNLFNKAGLYNEKNDNISNKNI